MKRIAVVGSGVSGLGAAFDLVKAGPNAHVVLLEAGAYFGGHANTVDVTLPDASGRQVTHGVDTGFLVCNERTYPRLLGLLEALGVEIAKSDMSFSVQVPAAAGAVKGLDAWLSGLQWCGSSLNTVFAQRRNLFSPGFWRMLRDLMRFNQLTTAMALRGDDVALAQPIGEFLDAHGFGGELREGYLLPMVACIWSCPTQQMLQFPIGTLIRFCHNHGLLQVSNRPQWFTVKGGSREYVKKIVAALPEVRLNSPVTSLQRDARGVCLTTPQGPEWFDEVVLACHSDQALALLGDQASAAEKEVLGAIAYHPNRAVLHTDASLLPVPLAWAAWNYERTAPGSGQESGVCLHYLLNRLQPLPWTKPVVVSLNPLRQPRADTVLAEFDYTHPVFDMAAVEAQKRLPSLQGAGGVWFCGAWTGYGFHEDGLKSGQWVAQALLARLQKAA